MVAYIRAGAFDWVAARACRVGQTTFYRWLELGAKRRAKRLFREFREEVATARAEARIAAEVEIRTENPLAWLRYGPGRDRPGEPGWTESSTVALTAQPGAPLRVVVEYVDVTPDGTAPPVAAPASVAGNGDRRRDPV